MPKHRGAMGVAACYDSFLITSLVALWHCDFSNCQSEIFLACLAWRLASLMTKNCLSQWRIHTMGHSELSPAALRLCPMHAL